MIETRIVGTAGIGVQEVEVRDVVGSRGATLAFTNPMPTDPAGCTANTKAGTACKMPPLRGEAQCMSHKGR